MGTSAYGEWETILEASECQAWKCQRWLACWWYQTAMSSPLRWCHRGHFWLGLESTDFICRKAGWQTKSRRCFIYLPWKTFCSEGSVAANKVWLWFCIQTLKNDQCSLSCHWWTSAVGSVQLLQRCGPDRRSGPSHRHHVWAFIRPLHNPVSGNQTTTTRCEGTPLPHRQWHTHTHTHTHTHAGECGHTLRGTQTHTCQHQLWQTTVRWGVSPVWEEQSPVCVCVCVCEREIENW